MYQPLDWDIYLITVEPAITKCHSTEKIVHYGGVFIITKKERPGY